MKKLIVLAVVAALVGAVPVVSVDAAKKKKKSKPVAVEKKFFLRDGDGCDTSENFLSLEDGPDTGCNYVDSGIAYDVLIASGQYTGEDLSTTWTTSDGVPVQLDATKNITGEITTKSYQGAVGAGQASLTVKVVADEQTELGTFTESFTLAPTQTHTSKVEIELEDALNKATFQTIKVFTMIHGASVGHTTVSLDEPASFVTIPAFEKAKKKKKK